LIGLALKLKVVLSASRMSVTVRSPRRSLFSETTGRALKFLILMMSEELSLFDVLHLIQNNSEKVISFSSAPINRQLSHFWVVDCDLGRVDKVLREHNCTMSVVHSED
jgi:hypothetical protein